MTQSDPHRAGIRRAMDELAEQLTRTDAARRAQEIRGEHGPELDGGRRPDRRSGFVVRPPVTTAEPMLLDPARCTCRKPTLIATFDRERLAGLELRHLRSAGCAYPTQPLDVETWRKPW